MRVVAKERIAADVVALTLADEAGGRLPDWTPGSHIDLVLPDGTVRQYSLCGDRWDPYTYRIGVLREPGGRGGSAWVHDRLAVGDVVGLGGPRNNFPLVPAERYLFVAGGIGITPLLPMIHQADLLGADWRLLFGGRRLPFAEDLIRYRDRVLLRPGRLRLDLAGFLASPAAGTRIYGCGPAPLLDAVSRACASLPPYTLRTERFVPDAVAAPVRSESFEVELARSGRTVTVAPGGSVLDAVNAAGVDVLSSCRRGVCGTCETTVLGGLPDHRDSVLDDAERAAGTCMFVCVSRSRTSRLVLDL